MNRVVLSVMTCLAIRMAVPAAAAAQAGFTSMALEPGSVVRVTEADGTRTSGKLGEVTSNSITVGDRTFSSSSVTRVERRGDRLWNGLAIGAGAGLAMSAIPSEACTHKSGVECALTGM